MSGENAVKIHGILGDYLHGYIPTQEITYASSQIIQNPTEETVKEMTTYLMQFDKEFIPLQTVNVKSIINNQVRFAMSEVRKIIASESGDDTSNPDDSGETPGEDNT